MQGAPAAGIPASPITWRNVAEADRQANAHRRSAFDPPAGGALKSETPEPREAVRGFAKRIRQRPTLPHGFPCSTIGDEGLNFRVRDGNGWDPLSIATGKLVSALSIESPLGSTKEPRASRAQPYTKEGLSLSRRVSCPGPLPGPAIAFRPASLRQKEEWITKPLARLVPVSSTRCRAYTSGLSTS